MVAAQEMLLPASIAVGAALAVALTHARCRRNKEAHGPRVAWEWFCFSNVVAVCALALSCTYLVNTWMAPVKAHGFIKTLTNPAFAGALAVAASCLLYLFAFFGVAFIHDDVTASLRDGPAEPLPATRPPASARTMDEEYDADVVIVGAGTAGAALAAALARDGKKVVIIERDLKQSEKIIGELMQPGGIRVLERMGLAGCAKAAAVDSIAVEGYACITPNTTCKEDLILTYPRDDPRTLAEYMGVTKEGSELKRHTGHAAGAAGAAAGAPSSSSSASAAAASNGSVSGVGAGPNTCPTTGNDIAPRGRSFWNHKFVHQLRLAAMREPNVNLHVGVVKKLVTTADVGLASPEAVARAAAPGAPGAAVKSVGAHTVFATKDLTTIRTGKIPAPLFAGFDAHENPVPHDRTAAAVDRCAAASAADAKVTRVPAPPAVASGLREDANAVVGVAWTDETGAERVTTARMTVIADGMYSVLRPALHANKPATISYFCGLVLRHPRHQPPLPYPNRGHVIMADPHPVLLYQISPTETRVLVDVPVLYSVEDGSLRRYFEETIAPQLPEVCRPAFLEACATQEPMCMPNRALWAVKTQVRGAVLLGDAWNMRHPLTGGGMTVALKDTEMLANALRGLDMQSVSWSQLEANIAAMQAKRQQHAATINVLACALHRVFTKPVSDDGTRARLRAACIEYMSMGGPCTAGPVGLLSGLVPKPGVLVAHFFAVASHAIRRALLPCPTPTKLRHSFDLLKVACIIIMPMLESEKVTFLSSPLVLGVTNALFKWRGADLSK